MKLMTTCKLMLKVLVPLVLIVMMVSTVYAAPPTQLWSDAVGTNDIALSKDGNYVAIVSGNQIRFYGRSSATPLWTSRSQDEFSSVAISADGDCVAVGGMFSVYFWKNARTLTGSGIDTQTWVSVPLGGSIDRRCLDISDDGNYVVAGRLNDAFYWANAKSRSTTTEQTTWTYSYPAPTVLWAIDLSSDGDYVAASFDSRVVYWKNARTLTGTQSPVWTSTEPDSRVVDVAISDDGNYVVVASELDLSVHYWANAKSLTGNPASTWWGGVDVSFSSVDMSSDGDSVVAGASSPSGVYFWGGARGMTGKPQNPSWVYTTGIGIHDVTIDDAGDYMAAAQSYVEPHKAYFFGRAGDLKWSLDLDNPSLVVSISGDGGTLAVGTEAPTTGYLLSTGYSSGPRPVAGVVLPTSKLEIVAPFAALAGLVIAVSAVVVVKKRRD